MADGVDHIDIYADVEEEFNQVHLQQRTTQSVSHFLISLNREGWTRTFIFKKMRCVFTALRLQARALALASQANASAHNEMSRMEVASQIARSLLAKRAT